MKCNGCLYSIHLYVLYVIFYMFALSETLSNDRKEGWSTEWRPYTLHILFTNHCGGWGVFKALLVSKYEVCLMLCFFATTCSAFVRDNFHEIHVLLGGSCGWKDCNRAMWGNLEVLLYTSSHCLLHFDGVNMCQVLERLSFHGFPCGVACLGWSSWMHFWPWRFVDHGRSHRLHSGSAFRVQTWIYWYLDPKG